VRASPPSPRALALVEARQAAFARLLGLLRQKRDDLSKLLGLQKEISEAYTNLLDLKQRKKKTKERRRQLRELTTAVDLGGLFSETIFLYNTVSDCVRELEESGTPPEDPTGALLRLVHPCIISTCIRFSNKNSEASRIFDILLRDPDWNKPSPAGSPRAPGGRQSWSLTTLISHLRLSVCLLYAQMSQIIPDVVAAYENHPTSRIFVEMASLIAELPRKLEISATRHYAARLELQKIRLLPSFEMDAAFLSREFHLKDAFYLNEDRQQSYVLLLFDDMLIATKADPDFPSMLRFFSRTFFHVTSFVQKRKRCLHYRDTSFNCTQLLLHPVDDAKLDRWYASLTALLNSLREQAASSLELKWEAQRQQIHQTPEAAS
jgi:hypothetical protein